MVKIARGNKSTPADMTGEQVDEKRIVKGESSDRVAARLVWIHSAFPNILAIIEVSFSHLRPINPSLLFRLSLPFSPPSPL